MEVARKSLWNAWPRFKRWLATDFVAGVKYATDFSTKKGAPEDPNIQECFMAMIAAAVVITITVMVMGALV